MPRIHRLVLAALLLAPTPGQAAPKKSKPAPVEAPSEHAPPPPPESRDVAPIERGLPASSFLLTLRFTAATPAYLFAGLSGAFNPAVTPTFVVGWRLFDRLE